MCINLTIHRGSKEIGGTCIELRSGDSRILIDFGLPLVDENKGPFLHEKIHNQTNEDLTHSGVLPEIAGLYKDEPQLVDGILLSHPHPDHYGLLSFVNPNIPVYMSRGCQLLIEVSYFFGQTDYELENVKSVTPWKQFKIGNFLITPYLVDHSGFDALAFLIECDGKRIFYTGDFRGHGRKDIVFKNLLKNPPKNIDYLILEGTLIDRDITKYNTEQDVEEELTNLFKDQAEQFFIACSSQNIDRIVSIYRACVRSNRIFIIDPYTAFVLSKLKELSPNIPQSDWGKNLRVFFMPSSYTNKLAEDKSLFKFKTAKITYEEIKTIRNRIVIKDSYNTREKFANNKDMNNSILIYSMWKGYLQGVKEFWEKHHVPIIEVHSSGHAYIGELKDFVMAIKPKNIIPIHTFYPEKYSDYFSYNIMITEDKVPVEL